ncbi:HD domain-containing protein [Rhodohalobacter mucosus]|uniref:Phosphohydrolase n=1 Tax=Rhodohalobacter mucosus TaxID=2079485 RepID=A0A316TUB5_9BACT|nr:HD domain-containing protein [Rhodohalobacter mucosus]PWN05914.1 phosphohydrolase [Rhodohalobacter mucosus]
MDIQLLEKRCREYISSLADANTDTAHDLNHTERVVENAKLILSKENADEEVTIAAAWLHDCVVLPKNDPDRHAASTMAANKAIQFLQKIGFDEKKHEDIAHAIKVHSFSADMKPRTLEAKIVQDADRLDALGAIGLARCFLVGGSLNRSLYNRMDPFCVSREPDDTRFTVDHFYSKLFKLPDLMKTETGKKEARKRVDFMKEFIKQLHREIPESGR